MTTESSGPKSQRASAGVNRHDGSDARSTKFDRQLMTAFELSAAEARLAALLVQGVTLDQAAERLDRSKETLRSQLHAVFAKTHTNRQVDLVALILRQIGHVEP